MLTTVSNSKHIVLLKPKYNAYKIKKFIAKIMENFFSKKTLSIRKQKTTLKPISKLTNTNIVCLIFFLFAR